MGSLKFVMMTFRGPTKFVLSIRNYSAQDMIHTVIHAQYNSMLFPHLFRDSGKCKSWMCPTGGTVRVCVRACEHTHTYSGLCTYACPNCSFPTFIVCTYIYEHTYILTCVCTYVQCTYMRTYTCTKFGNSL